MLGGVGEKAPGGKVLDATVIGPSSIESKSTMSQLPIEQVFQAAIAHHQAGQLPQAEALYQEILDRQAQHIGAMLNLGVIAGQMGRNDDAVRLLGRAVALSPNIPEAHYNLGNALSNIGRTDEAIAAYQKAVGLKPGYAEAHFNLGNGLRDKGELEEAIAAYQRAIVVKPGYAEAHFNLGNVLRDKGQLDAAVTAYQRAIALNPQFPEALNNLGNVQRDQGQLDEAALAYQRAIVINPNFADAHYDLGIVLKDKGLLDEAIAAFGRAIAVKPDYAEAHNNLANAMRDRGQLDEATAIYRRAIELDPNLPEAHYNLSLALLMAGDLEKGWPEYEWRWKSRNFSAYSRGFSQPVWDGGDLKGRTILLYAEQGFGDTIQFIRYAPLVAGRGGRVIVEAPPPLIGLLRQVPGVEQWIPSGEPLPAFDVQCSPMSLPLMFGATLKSIAAQKEYLRAEEQLVEDWRRRLAGQADGLKVGIAWAGSPTFKGDRTRSLSLDRLAPLGSVSGVTFFTLQKGAAAEQADRPPAGMRLVNLSGDLADFADTAAVMSQMDLVITTDTSVAHLAGALGRPVWVMLQFMPDWRWLLDREDSPWYPSMRLVRQKRLGDWEGVIERVVEGLRMLGDGRAG
jgi:tetratricopeptide (TPR) repeat protein